ncbi:hypothetical protein [Persicobacter psychrovividus]|uniref:Lipocalin-like domain-containing protein n=1 Tax=Persicobacter psychrovividus TaxID=387638 RepID=A0ABM7VFI9_9BACT|nr:hypothetical protein PEPS_19970 [Persicobacter psychrovividus]
MTNLFNHAAKLFFFIGAIALMTACGGDDPAPTPEPENPQETQSKLLMGMWGDATVETTDGDDSFDALTLKFGNDADFKGGSLEAGGVNDELAAFGDAWAFAGSSTTSLSVGGGVETITIESISETTLKIKFSYEGAEAAREKAINGVGSYTVTLTKN